MKHTLEKLGLIMLLLIVGGCSHIKMQSTAFYQQSPPLQAAVFVVAADDSQASSLAFQHYKQQFEFSLAQAGYRIVAKEKAELMVSIAYGVEGQTMQKAAKPSSGVRTSVSVGRGSAGRHGSIGFSTGTGNATAVSSNTQYHRFLSMEFIPAQSWATDNPAAVYQRSITSLGPCGDVNLVFEPMLQAMFAEYPGVSGETIMLEVKGKEQC